MSDLQSKVSALLERKVSLANGDLYAFLGLSALESDVKTIEKGINATIVLVKSKRPSTDKETWDTVVRWIQESKATLLDPEKKTAYDSRWTSAKPRTNPKSTVPTPLDATEIQQAQPAAATSPFPKADPNEPFNMGAYVESLTDNDIVEDSVEERLEALRQELRLERWEWEGTPVQPMGRPAVSESIALGYEPVVEQVGSEKSLTPFSGSQPMSSLNMPARSSTRTRSRSKGKSNSNWLLVGTILFGSLVVFGIGATMFASKYWIQRSKQKSPPGLAMGGPAPEESSPKPRDGAKGTKADENVISESSKFDVDLSKFDVKSPANGKPDSMNNDSTPMNSGSPLVPGENPAAEPAPPPPMERSKVLESLKRIRGMVDEGNFDNFDQEVERLTPNVQDQPLQEMLARLDQLGQLKRIFLNAMQRSLSKLKAGETFPIGSKVANFVERGDDLIKFKLEGKVETHTLKEVPLTVALALADMSLDSSNGTDLGARGVYCYLYPKDVAASRQMGDTFFAKAAASGQLRPDLKMVFQDKYE